MFTKSPPRAAEASIDLGIARELQVKRPPREILYDGTKLRMDYGCISPPNVSEARKPVVLVTGFGSGWRGIAELGYYLAVRNWSTVMVSLPGYGNSDDPPPAYYRGSIGFSDEAEALMKFAIAMQGEWNGSAHFVGHSLGAAIITELARWYPERVESLTLLNPAGFERHNMLALAAKFTACGMLHRATFRGDAAWPKLQPFLPKERSPFARERLAQRVSEWRRISGNAMAEILPNVPKHVPIAYITGNKDFVFPMEDSGITKCRLLDGRRHMARALPLWHNTTMFGSDVTADAINEFLLNI